MLLTLSLETMCFQKIRKADWAQALVPFVKRKRYGKQACIGAGSSPAGEGEKRAGGNLPRSWNTGLYTDVAGGEAELGL